jgi:hypothetical protein
MPVRMRSGAGVSPSSPTSRVARPFGMDAPLAPETGASMALSSASEFHSPHASQRPAHFVYIAPQLWQANLSVIFPIAAV